MATIMGIDPGGTIGVAMKIGDIYRTFPIKDEAPALWDWFKSDSTRPDQVVIERFATAGRISSHGLNTVEIVGGVKSLCWVFGVPLAVRAPQQRYAFMDDAETILKAIGARYVIHEHDALAHVLAWEHWMKERAADARTSGT